MLSIVFIVCPWDTLACYWDGKQLTNMYKCHPAIVWPSGCWPARRPASCSFCMTKTLMLDITSKVVNLDSFMPTILIGTIDLYHIMPLWQPWPPEGHKVSGKHSMFASFYYIHFFALCFQSGLIFSFCVFNVV